MKKISVFVIASLFAVAVSAQNGTKETKTTKTSSTASKDGKEHVCTAACKDGKHVYAHGEKGHTCTDACKKTSSKK